MALLERSQGDEPPTIRTQLGRNTSLFADLSTMSLSEVSDGSLAEAATSKNDPFVYFQLRGPFINSIVTRDVLNIVGNMTERLADAQLFFATIYAWMPIISRQRYYEDIGSLSVRSCADLALLMLCIRLVTQEPKDVTSDNMRSSLYALAKSHFAVVEATGILSTRTIQSGLLIAIYEMGHGFSYAASTSISHCALSARQLGLHQLCMVDHEPDTTTLTSVEEGRRLWWGIIILERYVSTLFPLNLTLYTILPGQFLVHVSQIPQW